MDAREQTEGERRVRRLLIEPLHRRGLMRPAGQTQDQFKAMQDDLAARLAYMSEPGLMALEEQCAAHPGGKALDRFPIGSSVLKWAALIEPPADSTSPLIRAVFGHAIGETALQEGYAPELLMYLRKQRSWPSAFVLSKIRADAAQAVRGYARIEEALARGDELNQSDADFRARRKAVIEKCCGIAALAKSVA